MSGNWGTSSIPHPRFKWITNIAPTVLLSVPSCALRTPIALPALLLRARRRKASSLSEPTTECSRFQDRNSEQHGIEFVKPPDRGIDGDFDLGHGQGIVGLYSDEQPPVPEMSCRSAAGQLPSLLQRFEPIHNDNGFERGDKEGPHRRDETRRRGHFHRKVLFQQFRGIQRNGLHTIPRTAQPTLIRAVPQVIISTLRRTRVHLVDFQYPVVLHSRAVLQPGRLLQSYELHRPFRYYALDITDARTPNSCGNSPIHFWGIPTPGQRSFTNGRIRPRRSATNIT